MYSVKATPLNVNMALLEKKLVTAHVHLSSDQRLNSSFTVKQEVIGGIDWR